VQEYISFLCSDVGKTLPNRSNCDARLRRLSDSDWLSTTRAARIVYFFKRFAGPSVDIRHLDGRAGRRPPCVGPTVPNVINKSGLSELLRAEAPLFMISRVICAASKIRFSVFSEFGTMCKLHIAFFTYTHTEFGKYYKLIQNYQGVTWDLYYFNLFCLYIEYYY